MDWVPTIALSLFFERMHLQYNVPFLRARQLRGCIQQKQAICHSFGDVQYLTEIPWADLIRLSLIIQVGP